MNSSQSETILSPTRMRSGAFRTTRWSLVVEAGDEGGRALEELLKAYWYPLYAFLRRSGHPECDAEDLTQGFLAHLLGRERIGHAHREKGRFRSFLLGALKKFVANVRRHDQAEKRGGTERLLSIDEERGEERFQLEPVDGRSPSDLFDRAWAFSVLKETMERLRGEFEAAGRASLFEALQPRLSGSGTGETYRETGARLGMSESAVTVTVHRMRRRFGEILREDVAETLERPEEVEDEIRYLMEVVSR